MSESAYRLLNIKALPHIKLGSNTGQKAAQISHSGNLLVEYALDVSERPVFTDLSVSAEAPTCSSLSKLQLSKPLKNPQ